VRGKRKHNVARRQIAKEKWSTTNEFYDSYRGSNFSLGRINNPYTKARPEEKASRGKKRGLPSDSRPVGKSRRRGNRNIGRCLLQRGKTGLAYNRSNAGGGRKGGLGGPSCALNKGCLLKIRWRSLEKRKKNVKPGNNMYGYLGN